MQVKKQCCGFGPARIRDWIDHQAIQDNFVSPDAAEGNHEQAGGIPAPG
jgi:hypothetical protein